MMQRDNMHPELAALSAFIVSWLVHIAEAHDITVTPDEYAGLVGCVMYLVQRLARWLFPDNTLTVNLVKTETVIQAPDSKLEKSEHSDSAKSE